MRLDTAGVLGHTDPKTHREVFEIARYDPNPQVAELVGRRLFPIEEARSHVTVRRLH